MWVTWVAVWDRVGRRLTSWDRTALRLLLSPRDAIKIKETPECKFNKRSLMKRVCIWVSIILGRRWAHVGLNRIKITCIFNASYCWYKGRSHVTKLLPVYLSEEGMISDQHRVRESVFFTDNPRLHKGARPWTRTSVRYLECMCMRQDHLLRLKRSLGGKRRLADDHLE